MGKKKRSHPDLEEILARPWCYYCERDFDDLKILIDHQKAKHFKCERCGRRLNTAGGLNVHMNQVHKENLASIDNALPNRSNLDVEIFGMEGIPEEIVSAHKQRVLSQYAQAEAERRAATGNPAPGGSTNSTGNPAKKPKFESPTDIKKRLAEHKAKVAADKAAGMNNGGGGATPNEGFGTQNPTYTQGPGFSHTPPFPQTPQYIGPPQPYGQPQASFPQQQPQFAAQGQGFPLVPPAQHGQPGISQPPQFPQAPFAQPQFQAGLPQFQNGPPRSFGSIPSPVPFRGQTPPQLPPQPQRTNSLSAAPGLPQRPSFSAPSVNAAQMQQMHSGQMTTTPSIPFNDGSQVATAIAQTHVNSQTLEAQNKPQTTAELVEKAPQNGVGYALTPPTEKTDNKNGEIHTEKKTKKDKDKDIKLIYSDNEVSPEEKMARLPRYAFEPSSKGETVLGEPASAVTGALSGYEDPIQNQS